MSRPTWRSLPSRASILPIATSPIRAPTPKIPRSQIGFGTFPRKSQWLYDKWGKQWVAQLGYLHDCSGCFRLERLPGGAYTHWKAPPSHGTHVKRSFPIVAVEVAFG